MKEARNQENLHTAAQHKDRDSKKRSSRNRSKSPNSTAEPQEFSNLQSTTQLNAKGRSKSPRPQNNNKTISSEEFSSKVYSRFEKFIEDREEKIKAEYEKDKSKKKVSIKDFKNKTLNRFNQCSRNLADKKEEIKESVYREMTGHNINDHQTVDVKTFENTTLHRFDLYQKKSIENLNRKKMEFEELEKSGGLTTSSRKKTKKELLGSHKKQDDKRSKSRERTPQENQKIPKPIDKKVAQKFEDFVAQKERKKKSLKQIKEENNARDEMVDCTFKPKLVSKYSGPQKSTKDLIDELYIWKQKVEAKQTQAKLDVLMNEKQAYFKPFISPNSQKIYAQQEGKNNLKNENNQFRTDKTNMKRATTPKPTTKSTFLDSDREEKHEMSAKNLFEKLKKQKENARALENSVNLSKESEDQNSVEKRARPKSAAIKKSKRKSKSPDVASYYQPVNHQPGKKSSKKSSRNTSRSPGYLKPTDASRSQSPKTKIKRKSKSPPKKKQSLNHLSSSPERSKNSSSSPKRLKKKSRSPSRKVQKNLKSSPQQNNNTSQSPERIQRSISPGSSKKKRSRSPSKKVRMSEPIIQQDIINSSSLPVNKQNSKRRVRKSRSPLVTRNTESPTDVNIQSQRSRSRSQRSNRRSSSKSKKKASLQTPLNYSNGRNEKGSDRSSIYKIDDENTNFDEENNDNLVETNRSLSKKRRSANSPSRLLNKKPISPPKKKSPKKRSSSPQKVKDSNSPLRQMLKNSRSPKSKKSPKKRILNKNKARVSQQSDIEANNNLSSEANHNPLTNLQHELQKSYLGYNEGLKKEEPKRKRSKSKTRNSPSKDSRNPSEDPWFPPGSNTSPTIKVQLNKLNHSQNKNLSNSGEKKSNSPKKKLSILGAKKAVYRQKIERKGEELNKNNNNSKKIEINHDYQAGSKMQSTKNDNNDVYSFADNNNLGRISDLRDEPKDIKFEGGKFIESDEDNLNKVASKKAQKKRLQVL